MGGGENPEKHKIGGDKIPSFKIGGAKSRFNQNMGGKILSFKIGRVKFKLNQNRGVKLHNLQNMEGKIPSFKIGRVKFRFNQNRGGKTAFKPYLKYKNSNVVGGGENPEKHKIGGVKLRVLK